MDATLRVASASTAADIVHALCSLNLFRPIKRTYGGTASTRRSAPKLNFIGFFYYTLYGIFNHAGAFGHCRQMLSLRPATPTHQTHRESPRPRNEHDALAIAGVAFSRPESPGIFGAAFQRRPMAIAIGYKSMRYQPAWRYGVSLCFSLDTNWARLLNRIGPATDHSTLRSPCLRRRVKRLTSPYSINSNSAASAGPLSAACRLRIERLDLDSQRKVADFES